MKYSTNNSSLAIFSLILTSFIILLILSSNPTSFHSWQKSFSSKTTLPIVEKDELETVLEKASMPNKTVIITVINKAYVEPHKNEYPTMFDIFLEGFWTGEGTRPLVGNLLVVTMDETAHQRCLFRRLNCYRMEGGSGDEFSGEKIYMSDGFIEMMWRRTAFLLRVLKKGYSFIFTDTDVLWLRDPYPRLTEDPSLELHVSTDEFKGNSTSPANLINTGFYFIRSNNKTISFFQTWYDERNNAPGWKEQDVLKKILRQGILSQIGINGTFLDTNYFSGFCENSKDVKSVATVHANCCQTIAAKVIDLKAVLKDWERFKDLEKTYNRSDGNFTDSFQWSKHIACNNSWFDSKGRFTVGLNSTT